MAQARRRIPYTMGAEPLGVDARAAARQLHPREESRLTASMQSLYAQLLPTEESEHRRQRLIEKLERLFRERWPGHDIVVSVFGSTGNTLGTNDSDVDVCITTSCREIEHVCAIADLLARSGMERVVCVSSAKVPIVKLWDPELQVACDINVNNPIALENTALIKSYVAIDDRFRPLAMIVKYWAKRRMLNDAGESSNPSREFRADHRKALGGTLSSYTWICLVLSFLQTRKPPVMPTLQGQPGLKRRVLDGVNIAFDKDLSKYRDFGHENRSSLGELLFQFFHYYGHVFDFETDVVSVRLGRLVKKSEKAWHLLQDNRLCVEEPFNVSRNLANTADDTSMRGIHIELRRACNLLAAGKLQECCEEYVPAQVGVQTRHTDAFVQPQVTKAIVPQLPSQLQTQSQRLPKATHKGGRSNNRQGGNRRSSQPNGRNTTHLHDLPFAMTPQELQLQQQHQQHLLHDQLFQQYQYLQMQEQELRLQLHRQKGLMAASGYTPTDFSGTSTDDDQESLISSRILPHSSRLPMTTPLYPSRFSSNPFHIPSGLNSPGIATNPTSPLLTQSVLDSQRLARRDSITTLHANAMRAQSQPARSVPGTPGFPPTLHRFDVPVRQVEPSAPGRMATATVSQSNIAILNGPMQASRSRYDIGRRPMEYVGYYVGQPPSFPAYPASTTVSPAPSSVGLAIHNSGLSPRLSTRSSRIASSANSPSLRTTPVVNGSSHLAPLEENHLLLMTDVPPREGTPPPVIRGPLIVDGSINSPPRRLARARPVRRNSDDGDASGTTSEDVAFDTPCSSDNNSHHEPAAGETESRSNTDGKGSVIVPEKEYLSLNGSSVPSGGTNSLQRLYNADKLTAQLNEAHAKRLYRRQGLAAASHSVEASKLGQSTVLSAVPSSPVKALVQPLASLSNGHVQGQMSPPSTSNDGTHGVAEWQAHSKRKKKSKRTLQADATEPRTNAEGGEIMPLNERERKGG